MKNIWNKYYWLLIIVVIIIANILIDESPWMLDLTADKRYSLTSGTIELLQKQEEPILAEVLFEGDFPAGYQRLQSGVKDILRRMQSYYPNLRIVVADPLKGEEEEVNNRMQNFNKVGLVPMQLTYPGNVEFRAVNAFPYVVFNQGQKRVIVSLLEGTQIGSYSDELIFKALSQLEYKFANSIQKINQSERKKIAFIEGLSPYGRPDLIGLEKELSKFYHLGRFNLDTVDFIHPQIDILIIPTVAKTLPDKYLLAIDQYVMNGGNILWMLDNYDINLDSIRSINGYVPVDFVSNIDNLLFKYGVRINQDLVVDKSCSTIPIVVSNAGGRPQYEFFDWYYHPVPAMNGSHPITSTLADLNLYFPSSIDTLGSNGKVTKTVLLFSSDYSKAQTMPRPISFELLREPPIESYFDQQELPLAVLLEGNFLSFFENRLTSDLSDLHRKYELQFKAIGEASIQVIVSDADFILTNFAPDQQMTELPVGYNYFENKNYPGNLEFVLNVVEYMTGNKSLLPAKKNKIIITKLDEIKAQRESGKWQLVNIALPLLLLSLFGILYHWWRKSKYAKI